MRNKNDIKIPYKDWSVLINLIFVSNFIQIPVRSMLIPKDPKALKRFHFVSDSHFIKSFAQVRGYDALHIFYNQKSLNFSAILEDNTVFKIINDTNDDSTVVRVPLLDCNAGRDKLLSLQYSSASCPSLLQFIDFLRREIRYPILQEDTSCFRIQLNCGGLLGGGCKVSRPVLVPTTVMEKIDISEDQKEYVQIYKFLIERYKIQETSGKDTNDQTFAKILAKEICQVLPQSESSDIGSHISEHIDIYEEELFADALLKLLGKSKKDGNPSLTDYTRNFDSSELSIQLLRKGYFANQKRGAKHELEHLINERVLDKLTEEIKPLTQKLENTNRGKAKGQPGDGLEAYFAVLDKKDKMTTLLRNTPKLRAKKVLTYIKDSLGLKTDKEGDLIIELCFSDKYDEIFEQAGIRARTFSPMKRSAVNLSRSPSPSPSLSPIVNPASTQEKPTDQQDSPSPKTSGLAQGATLSPALSPDTKKNDQSASTIKVSPLQMEEGKGSASKLTDAKSDKVTLSPEKGSDPVIKLQKAENAKKPSSETQPKPLPKQLWYLDKVRLSVLSEMNLITHDLNTLVELYNMLKLDQDITDAHSNTKETIGNINDTAKNLKLNDIRTMLASMIKGYRESESTLESTELSSLLPLAFVQDKDIFRSFLDAFLTDLRSDILLDPKKIRMLSLIIISALKNEDFQQYLKVDDLIQCLKILKPKIEDLSITSENVDLQEVMNSLNDILFLMGFIGAKGVKGEYADLVADLTKHMQSHGLEKTFNMLTGKAKDPSLEIKRNYALESFKRIEGTSFEEWTQNLETLLQVGEIAIGIGKGVFMSDLGSMTDALLQIKDLLVQAYANRPKTWYDDANNLRFLLQEPIEKIIAEVFPEKSKGSNTNYTFFVVEFLLAVIAQPERKSREKKAAIQALWFLANGLDYKQQEGLSYPVRSDTFKLDRDIISYVKKSLLNIAQNVDININIYIRKLVENPIRFEYTDTNYDEPFALVRLPKAINQEDSPGKQFYLKILREKTPRLYGLASIQEHSDKTLDKPSILVSYRVIERERDYDNDIRRKLIDTIANTTSSNIKWGAQQIKSLDARTTTKKSLTDIVEGIVARTEGAKKADDNKKTEEPILSEEEKNKKRKEEVSLISNVLQEKIDEILKISTFDIFDTLENFLEDPLKKVLVIQGDAGAGKTMLVRLFEQKLWKRYNISLGRGVGSHSRLPLRIVLSEVRSLEKAVDDFLINHGCDSVGVRDIKKKPAAILFDGYDEINQPVNLYDLNNLDEWKDVKVIFTSRKENLTVLKDAYIDLFTPGRDAEKVLSYVIQPINEEQIRTYFKAQAAEDQQEANKLERNLKELKQNAGADYNFIENVIMKDVEYLEKIPQSDAYQHLCETLHSLEEHLPEIEQLQEEINTLKIEGLQFLPLTEVFAKRIDMLKRMIDEEYLKELAASLRGKALAVHKIEDYIAFLGTYIKELDSDEDVLDWKGYKNSANSQNLVELLKEATWFIYEDEDRLLKSSLFTPSNFSISAQVERWLNIYEERCVPEYFAANAEIMRKDLNACMLFLGQLKKYESLQVMAHDSLITAYNIQEFISKIENFSQFEKAKVFIKKTREQLPEWKAVEEELKSLLKEQSDDEVAQFNEGAYKLTDRFKKLKNLIAKHEMIWKEFYQELQELEIFNQKLIYSSRIGRTGASEELYQEGTTKNDLGVELRGLDSNFEDLNKKVADFVYLSSHNSSLIECHVKAIKDKRIFYDRYIDPAIKSLTHKLKEIQQATEELDLFRTENQEGSHAVKLLHEQILKLRGLYPDKLSSVVQRLDGIAIELKTLDDQVKAIKTEVTEEALKIASLQRQITNLRRFSNAESVDLIVTKFKDITTSPFMLRMLVQTLVKYPKSSANKAELYRLFSNIHFEREKERLLKTEKIPAKFNIIDSFYDYSGDLAINMFIRKVTSIQFKNSGYKKKGIMKTEKKELWSRFFDDSNVMTRLARRGAQIVEDDGVIRFVHKSIMEYFAARQFYDDVVNYDPNELESYDPCLNAGYIIDNETAVYHFLKYISASNTKKNEPLTVFDKKLLEILNSSALQKLYGDNFEQNFFYPNIFLMILLRDKLQFKIGMLKEDSPSVAILEKIMRWILNLSGSLSEASLNFADMIKRANKASLISNEVFQQILSIHYHLVTKKEDTSCCEDRFVTEKNRIQVKVCLSAGHSNKTLGIKDGIVFEQDHIRDAWLKMMPPEWPWILEGKLFIHGSQDMVVILKHRQNKCLVVSSDRKPTPTEVRARYRYGMDVNRITELALNDTKSAWDNIENKWLLRLTDPVKTEFTLVSLADSSKFIYGGFKNEEEYLVFFKGICTYDIHTNPVNDYDLTCLTCSPDQGSKYTVCKNCVNFCHKGHQVVAQNGSLGYCGCRFAGNCKIAYGCTEKLKRKEKDEIKFKCNECPADKRDRVLCNGCIHHHKHETGHENVDQFITIGKCECDCMSNKTRITVEANTSYFPYDFDKQLENLEYEDLQES